MALTTCVGLMACALSNSVRAWPICSGGQAAPCSLASCRSTAFTTAYPCHPACTSTTFRAEEPKSTPTMDFGIATSPSDHLTVAPSASASPTIAASRWLAAESQPLPDDLIDLKDWQEDRQGDKPDDR